jgi:hypothetical protein
MITFIIDFFFYTNVEFYCKYATLARISLKKDTLGREFSGFKTNSFTLSILARSGFMAHTEVGKAGLNDVSPKKALRPDKGQEMDF